MDGYIAMVYETEFTTKHTFVEFENPDHLWRWLENNKNKFIKIYEIKKVLDWTKATNKKIGE